MTPTQIGKYEILAEIGRGGFAVVYRARDTTLDRVVALKVLHAHWATEPQFATRFRQEARAAANLRHPHIVPVYDTGEADGQLYIAMAYLPGQTLHDRLEANGPLPLEQALPLLEQLADALDYAHGQGVVHRDLKPINVMVEDTPRGPVATLMDFGLIKMLESSTALTSQGTLLGSPEYMAPEQADPNRHDEIGPATDRYALGVLAYRMLAGRVPFPGNTPGTLNAHLNLDVPDPRRFVQDLPQTVIDALLIMLAKAPTARFPTAGAFVAQLRKVQEAKQQQKANEAQLAALHAQWQAAVAQQNWLAVLQVGGQIQALEPDDAEAAQWIAHARDQLRRPPQPSPTTRTRMPKPTRPKQPLPGWLKPVGMGLAAVILLGICLGMLGPVVWEALFPAATSTPTPTRSYVTVTPNPLGGIPPACTTAGATWTRPTDGMTLVCVPGGTFQMGSTDTAVGAALALCNQVYGNCTVGWCEQEQPVHTVTLDSFWIDQTEVTNEQYARCMTSGACEASTYADNNDYNGNRQPVVGVDWHNATAYCQWAGGELPTEAQWEYAARGTEGRVYPWSNDFREKVANCAESACKDGYEYSAPVGSFPAGKSWAGVLDLAGNVWEWTADWYAGKYSEGPQTNPEGPATGDSRVVRGGSWSGRAMLVRSSYRVGFTPTNTYVGVGFRCVVVRAQGQ